MFIFPCHYLGRRLFFVSERILTKKPEPRETIESFLKSNKGVAEKCAQAVQNWKDGVAVGKESPDSPTVEVITCALSGVDAKPRPPKPEKSR